MPQKVRQPKDPKEFAKQVKKEVVGGGLGKLGRWKPAQIKEAVSLLMGVFAEGVSDEPLHGGDVDMDLIVGTLKHVTGIRVPNYLKHAHRFLPVVDSAVSASRYPKGGELGRDDEKLIGVLANRRSARQDRLLAAAAISETTNPQALEVLCKSLWTSDAELRGICLESIGSVGGENALPFLIEGLKEPYSDTRSGALKGLLKACEYGDDDVNEFARQNASKPLLKVLASDYSIANRALAAQSLQALGVESAVTLIIPLINHRPRKVGERYMVGRGCGFFQAVTDEQQQRTFITLLGLYGEKTRSKTLKSDIAEVLYRKIISSDAEKKHFDGVGYTPEGAEKNPYRTWRLHADATIAISRVLGGPQKALEFLAPKSHDVEGTAGKNLDAAGNILIQMRDTGETPRD